MSRQGVLDRNRGQSQHKYEPNIMHAGKRSFYPLDPAIEAALDQSQVVSFEIKPGFVAQQPASPALMERDQEVQRMIYYQKLALDLRKDSAKWSDYKFKSQFARASILRELYEKRQDPDEPWDSYDLFAYMLNITGYSFNQGIEKYLYSRTKHTKSFVAAEPTELHDEHSDTIDESMVNLFDPFNPASLDAEIQASSGMLTAMWDDWQQGKVSKLRWWDDDYAIMVRRNRAMATTFTQLLLDGQKPFMAVGAGHMGGGKGVIALLKARGLTTKRVLKTKTIKGSKP
jgi:uncharacterized protein YbaP (TraB family)